MTKNKKTTKTEKATAKPATKLPTVDKTRIEKFSKGGTIKGK